MNVPLLVPALVAIAVFFVLLPVAAATYLYYRRRPKEVRCPEDGRPAIVRVDAESAAAASLVDAHTRLITSCSFWPARSGCRQDCLAEPMRDALARHSRRN